MDKKSVILRLHEIAHTRLFGDAPWLIDRESGLSLTRTFKEMKLEEAVADDMQTSRSTTLGKELKIELVYVFAGGWDPYEAIGNLEEYELLTETEADQLRHRLQRGADPETLLRPHVQRAYFKYYGAGALPPAATITATLRATSSAAISDSCS
jgi:hypothetical protein